MKGMQDQTTLWTSKMSNWTRVLQGSEQSPEVKRLISESVVKLAEVSVVDRLKPYETSVTQDVLSYAVR